MIPTPFPEKEKRKDYGLCFPFDEPVVAILKPKVYEILTILNDFGEVHVRGLIDALWSSTVQNRIRELEELGLIRGEYRRVGRNVRVKALSITEKGRKVLEKLRELNSILKGGENG